MRKILLSLSLACLPLAIVGCDPPPAAPPADTTTPVTTPATTTGPAMTDPAAGTVAEPAPAPAE